MTSVENPCRNCGVTLNGYSGLPGIRSHGSYSTHRGSDCIRNLRQRAEKAEAERDALQARVVVAEGRLNRQFVTNATLREAVEHSFKRDDGEVWLHDWWHGDQKAIDEFEGQRDTVKWPIND